MPGIGHQACPHHTCYFRKQEIPVPARESEQFQVPGLDCRYSRVQPSSLPVVSPPQWEVEFRQEWGTHGKGCWDPHMVGHFPWGLQVSLTLGPTWHSQERQPSFNWQGVDRRNHLRFHDYLAATLGLKFSL